MVVNARHIKTVPGRKTDVKDAEWIASLLRHGLLRASFIPDRPQRELRELTRYRRIEERSRVSIAFRRCLKAATFSSVATDILGVSGRAMLDAMSEESMIPNSWRLARGRLRNKQDALEQALAALMSDISE